MSETSASRYAAGTTSSYRGDYDDAAPAPGYLSVHCSPRISSPARVQVLESSIANPPSKPGSLGVDVLFKRVPRARFFLSSCTYKCRLLFDFAAHTKRLSFSRVAKPRRRFIREIRSLIYFKRQIIFFGNYLVHSNSLPKTPLLNEKLFIANLRYKIRV